MPLSVWAPLPVPFTAGHGSDREDPSLLHPAWWGMTYPRHFFMLLSYKFWSIRVFPIWKLSGNMSFYVLGQFGANWGAQPEEGTQAGLQHEEYNKDFVRSQVITSLGGRSSCFSELNSYPQAQSIWFPLEYPPSKDENYQRYLAILAPPQPSASLARVGLAVMGGWWQVFLENKGVCYGLLCFCTCKRWRRC